ncbi:MAG: SCO family protein [Bacteroidetes bacterium]|nr:MAG: SCO family protein [Bacteroidota bacterium]
MKTLSVFFSAFLLILTLTACNDNPGFEGKQVLPCLGEKVKNADGEEVCPTIRDFSFIDQDSQLVTNETFAGKAYVVDFFFVSCPTICPKVTKQMLRLYETFKDEDRLLFLAHTIDPKHDTIPRLAKYARNLGVTSDKWHFVTGDKDAIYEIADDYFSIAQEDPDAPGGFNHSGRLILVDKDRHVRAFCDGTDPVSVDRFMGDIRLLLAEMGGDTTGN